MNIGLDTFFFKGNRLIRSPSGDQGKGNLIAADDLQLFLAKILGSETKYSNSPGMLAKQPSGLFQKRFHILALQHSQPQEGHCACISNLGTKRCVITDPGHGTLNDRIPCAVRAGQRRCLVKQSQFVGRFNTAIDGLPDSFQDTADGLESFGQRPGKCDILSNEPKIRIRIRPSDRFFDYAEPCILSVIQRKHIIRTFGNNFLKLFKRPCTRSAIDPQSQSWSSSQGNRLAPIHSG